MKFRGILLLRTVVYYPCWHRVGSPGQHIKMKSSAGVIFPNGDTGPIPDTGGCSFCVVFFDTSTYLLERSTELNWLKN